MLAEQIMLLGTNGPLPPTHAFVANVPDNSLTAISIADPSSMAFVSELTDGTNFPLPTKVLVDHLTSTAYVLSDNSGNGMATSVNIANPASMAVLDSHTGSKTAGAIDIAIDIPNKILWLLGNYLLAINIANPSALVELGSLNGFTGSETTLSLDLENEVAYITSYAFSQKYVYSVDISVPSAPVLLDTLPLGNSGTNQIYNATLTSGMDSLLVVSNTDDIYVVDVSDPADLSVAYTYNGTIADIEGGFAMTAIAGDIVILSAANNDALITLDTSDLSAIAEIDRESGATYLDAAKGHAFDPFRRVVYAVAQTGDEITSFDMDASGNLDFRANYSSATQLNGAISIALL